MNKNVKIALLVFTLTIVVSFGALGTAIYFKVVALKTFQYSTPKGQQYTLKYFPVSKVISGEQAAQKLDHEGFKTGGPFLASYLKDDLGIMMTISETIDKPHTKTCTGTDRFAFQVDDYEVCKQVLETGRTASLMAKIGNNGKYFVVVIGTLYDGKRILQEKDLAYIEEFNKFDILQYEDKLKTILRSIQPVN